MVSRFQFVVTKDDNSNDKKNTNMEASKEERTSKKILDALNLK